MALDSDNNLNLESPVLGLFACDLEGALGFEMRFMIWNRGEAG